MFVFVVCEVLIAYRGLEVYKSLQVFPTSRGLLLFKIQEKKVLYKSNRISFSDCDCVSKWKRRKLIREETIRAKYSRTAWFKFIL